MLDVTHPEDLTIQGTSWIEEISEQMITAAKEGFVNQNVEGDQYYNEFADPDAYGDLKNRATRATQILFDFFGSQPNTDTARKATNERLQIETDQVGFYVAFTSARDDGGRQRKMNCYRAISQLRRRFSRFAVMITVDQDQARNAAWLKIVNIDQVRGLPGITIYQIIWELEVKVDMIWREQE